MRALVLLIFIFSSVYVKAVDLSTINTHYWYDLSAPVQFSSRVISNNDSTYVFVKFDFRQQANYAVDYFLQKDYEDSYEKELKKYTIDSISNQPTQLFYKLGFEDSNRKLLIVRILFNDNYFLYPVALKRAGLSFPAFYPVDPQSGLPVLENYFVGDSVLITSEDGKNDLFLYRYQDNFPPADPPMGIIKNVNPSLRVDSLITGGLGKYDITPYHFYFVQNDTLTTAGFTFFAGSLYYPEYRVIDELVPPVAYFSKSSELNVLLSSPKTKKAFDNFWLRLYNTKSLAKNAIRNYFTKIFSANKLFTDYKQGWKTDRGILYVVFGRPNEVFRKNFKEIWRYDGGVEFEFRIISNLFAPELYILIRDDKYEQEWLNRTKTIRGGK